MDLKHLVCSDEIAPLTTIKMTLMMLDGAEASITSVLFSPFADEGETPSLVLSRGCAGAAHGLHSPHPRPTLDPATRHARNITADWLRIRGEVSRDESLLVDMEKKAKIYRGLTS